MVFRKVLSFDEIVELIDINNKGPIFRVYDLPTRINEIRESNNKLPSPIT